MPPHAPVTRGRDAIQRFLAEDSAGAKAAGLTLINGVETAGVKGDWGWNSRSCTIQDKSGQTVDSGSYLSASQKVAYNSDRPLPAAPQAK